jgi:hypothetical protein
MDRVRLAREVTMLPPVSCPLCGGPLTVACWTVRCETCNLDDPTGEFDKPDPPD